MNSSMSIKCLFWNLLFPVVAACILWPWIVFALIRTPAFTPLLGWVCLVLVGLIFPLFPLIEFLKCFRYDRYTTLTYDKQKKEVCYCRLDVHEVFRVDDIKSCSLISATSYAIMSYYLEIELESGKYLCLTSLLKAVPDIAEDTNPERYKEFFLKLPK